jgi:tetratricopeptide (TPR) repeat protein
MDEMGDKNAPGSVDEWEAESGGSLAGRWFPMISAKGMNPERLYGWTPRTEMAWNKHVRPRMGYPMEEYFRRYGMDLETIALKPSIFIFFSRDVPCSGHVASVRKAWSNAQIYHYAFHGKLAAKGQEKRICRGVGGIHVASRYVLKKMAEESPLFEPIWQDLQALSPDDFGFYMARDPDAAWLESIWPMEEQLFAEHRETRYRDFAGMKLAATTAEEKRLIEKADYLSAEGMADEAVAVAEEVLGDGSGHCNGWFRRHHYLMQADRCEEAYELVKRGMAAYPDAAVFYRMGADCCIRLERWAAAERHLRRVWGVNPWDHRVMLQWALAAFSMENYELSAQLHGLAAEHRSLPLAAQAFYDLSLAVCGRHGEVPTASERMLDLVDSNPWAQLFAAMEMAGGGEYEYALELCAEALAVGEEIVEIWSSYGFILLKLRRYEEAEAALLKAIEMNPEFDDAWRYLLHVYRDWGQAEKLAKAEARVGYFWPETLERFGREKGTDIRE